MEPKTLLSSFGLLFQALIFLAHFCAALPPHTHSHRQNVHGFQIARSSGSSGSSLILEPAGSTYSMEKLFVKRDVQY